MIITSTDPTALQAGWDDYTSTISKLKGLFIDDMLIIDPTTPIMDIEQYLNYCESFGYKIVYGFKDQSITAHINN